MSRSSSSSKRRESMAARRCTTAPARRSGSRLGAPSASAPVAPRRRRRATGAGGRDEVACGARRLRLRVRLAAVEAGGDDRDAHLVAEGVVDDGAEDDVRLGVHGLLHEPGGVVDLEDAEVRPALDREQHAVRAVDARLEQRATRRRARRP